MVNYSAAIFGSYIGLTLIYYFLKEFLANKKTALKVITYVYLLLLVGGMLGLIIGQIKSLCGHVEFGQVVSCFFPWIILLIFGALLKMCPGWKAPFSNTLGYLVTKVMGVNDTLNSILNTSYKSKDMQEIYNNPSMLINTFTPANFDMGINKLVSNKIFNPTSTNYKSHVERFKKLVKVKDDVSECFWYILVGSLVSSMTITQLANLGCSPTSKQMETNHASHNKVQSAAYTKAQTTKPTKYIVRD